MKCIESKLKEKPIPRIFLPNKIPHAVKENTQLNLAREGNVF